MKHKAEQKEMNWGSPEPFALVAESGIDHERLAREEAQRQKEQREAASKQAEFPGC